jgi:hypothetical protein
MSSIDLQKMLTWFTETLQPLLEEHAKVLGAILAALFILIFFLKRKLSKSIPYIAEGQVRIEPCDLPPCRFFTGMIVGSNKGRTRCRLMDLQLLHDHQKFEFSDITDRRDKEFTAPERGTVGIRLPVEIRAKSKKNIYFFGYHRIAKIEDLPETLSLKVTFGGRKKAFLYNIVRVLDETYCLRPLEKYPPKCLR